MVRLKKFSSRNFVCPEQTPKLSIVLRISFLTSSPNILISSCLLHRLINQGEVVVIPEVLILEVEVVHEEVQLE